VPIEETLEALNDVVRAGKALHIGASSMLAWQFAKALRLSEKHGWARFQTMQNYVNLLYREEEREMLPLCKAEGIGVIRGARSRAGASRATGTRAPPAPRPTRSARRSTPRPPTADRKVVEAVAAVAAAARPAARPGRARLGAAEARGLGADRRRDPLEQLDDAVAALSLQLSPEDIAELEAPYVPHAVIGHT
jgi:aryl-alcohol dehydrogenase-like predicted oxidoreductase